MPALYADTADGDDAHDGTSPADAVATLSALQDINDADSDIGRVSLRRGAEFDAEGFDAVEIDWLGRKFPGHLWQMKRSRALTPKRNGGTY